MMKPYVLRQDLTLVERETGREIGHLEHVTGSGADRGWRYVISWGLHPAVDGGFHRRYEAAAAAWGAFNAYMSTTDEPRTTSEWWERLKASKPKPRCGCPQKAHDLHRYDCKWSKEEV